jgi:hypothetical protein
MSRKELEWTLETVLRGGALMNEWPMEDRETVWLAEEQLEQLADLIAARLANTPIAPQSLVDAATLARQLGVSRATIYEHARELGAVRVGGGARSRLRFDPQQVRRTLGSKAAFSESPSARHAKPRAGQRRRPAQPRRHRNGPIWYRRYGIWLDPATGEPLEEQPLRRDGAVRGPRGARGATREQLQLHLDVARACKHGAARGSRWDANTLMYVHSETGEPLRGPGEESRTDEGVG